MHANEFFILNEGINDRYIGKVIFVLGAPGSGKDHCIRELLPNYGYFKIIDLDEVVYNIKKIDSINEKIIKNIDFYNNLDNDDITKKYYSMAYETLLKRQKILMDTLMHPIISNQTGRKFTNLEHQVQLYKENGYLVYILYVHCDKEESWGRVLSRAEKNKNNKDARTVSHDFFDTAYTGCVDTKTQLLSMFDEHNPSNHVLRNLIDGFSVVINSTTSADMVNVNKMKREASKKIAQFLNAPPSALLYKKINSISHNDGKLVSTAVAHAVKIGHQYSEISGIHNLIINATELININMDAVLNQYNNLPKYNSKKGNTR